MTTAAYEEITSADVDGQSNNPHLTKEENAEQARLVRSFRIPDKFSVDGARTPLKTINIAAAFISDDWVLTLSDFVRLSNLHVISRDEMWKAPDFEVSSEVCLSSPYGIHKPIY